MAAVLLFFLAITVACGVLAFGESGVHGTGVHIGFLIGMIGLVSLTVAMLAKWASNTLDDVPGQKRRNSR